MANDKVQGCVLPAAGPLAAAGQSPEVSTTSTKEKSAMSVMVGHAAPDFETSAYFQGGFRNFRLSEFKGKWVFLCFYPGDFTFV